MREVPFVVGVDLVVAGEASYRHLVDDLPSRLFVGRLVVPFAVAVAAFVRYCEL